MFMLLTGRLVYVDSTGGVKRWDGAIKDVALGEYYPSGIAVDDQYAYWVRRDGGVNRAVKKGGMPQSQSVVVPQGNEDIFSGDIAVDDKFVYWTGVSAVWRALKDAGVREIVAAGGWIPYGLIMDGDVLYWTTGTDARLFRKVKPAPPPP